MSPNLLIFLVAQAFDRVDNEIILAIKSYYDASQMLVQNGQEESEKFITTVGVRQGGILLTKLFNIYTGAMIKAVRNCKNGISLLKTNIGIVMYADDLTLVTDCETKMQQQLNLVGKQAIEDDTVQCEKINRTGFQ